MKNTLLKCLGLFVLSILFWIGSGVASPLPQMSHELTVRLEPSKQMLQATDAVTVTAPGASPLVFDLAEHLHLETVHLNDRKVRFSFKNGRVRIPIADNASKLRIRMKYGGRFSDAVDSEPINTDNPGFGVTGIISPLGTMLLAGANWYPKSRNSVSVYDITVDAPEGVISVTSGRPLGHSTENGRSFSRWKVEHPLRGIPLVAGPYTVTTRRFGTVTAATYFSAPMQHLSDAYLEATGRYLQLYQDLFGPYPFEQFAVVENFFPTGYGFPSFTLMGRRVLQLPFIIHTSLGHEIAHCWWGNGVLVDPYGGNWSEGLTTYVADYLYKERRGEGRSYRLQWLRNYADLIHGSNDFPISRFASRVNPATKAIGYDKVAMVFHMLRQTVGEDMFWSTLRDIYATRQFKTMSWSDLASAFKKRSQVPLDVFFNQWVDRPGAPVLSLSNIIVTQKQDGFEVKGAVLQQKPFYDLLLTLDLATVQNTVSQTINISGARTPFTFNISGQPKELVADPDVHLFRRLSPQELPPTINGIKGASAVTVVVAKHLGSKGLEIARRFSVAMGLSNSRIGVEGEFSPGDLSNSDLLFVGLPADRRWLPAGDPQFSVASDAFKLKGDGYSLNKSSFFGVFKHPNREGTSALLLPVDLSIGNRLVTKIPHYGKYSYLVFNNTRNHIKGTWAAATSPMVVRWSMAPKASLGGTQ